MTKSIWKKGHTSIGPNVYKRDVIKVFEMISRFK